ncbi:MAG: adenylate/guanylate cyclase domain-containing protein [Chloroflexi bacterium]|nr:adenylate/guanylate cyclase domain-containing protein [Chloroflexota bacterium]
MQLTARDLLREHERLVREALTAHDGTEVKTLGDGFMASFKSTSRAVECAIAMQRAFAERNESADEAIKVRVGLNAGEPIEEDEDLFGTAVNEAARITSIADGGEILVADVVRQLTRGKKFLFNDRGETSLRGFEDPVRLFEIRWDDPTADNCGGFAHGPATLATPLGPGCLEGRCCNRRHIMGSLVDDAEIDAWPLKFSRTTAPIDTKAPNGVWPLDRSWCRPSR